MSVLNIRLEHDRMPVIMASEVRNHQQRLKLRDRNGCPCGNLPRAARSLKGNTQDPRRRENTSEAWRGDDRALL
jgi:hypothetical protein